MGGQSKGGREGRLGTSRNGWGGHRRQETQASGVTHGTPHCLSQGEDFCERSLDQTASSPCPSLPLSFPPSALPSLCPSLPLFPPSFHFPPRLPWPEGCMGVSERQKLQWVPLSGLGFTPPLHSALQPGSGGPEGLGEWDVRDTKGTPGSFPPCRPQTPSCTSLPHPPTSSLLPPRTLGRLASPC